MGWLKSASWSFLFTLIGTHFYINFADARDDLVPGSRYTSARAAAMGDAFIPVGEDVPSGLFYNPANLAKIRVMQYDLSNLTLGVNSPFAANIGLGSVNLTNLNSFLPTIKTASPKLLGGGGSYMIDFGMPGLAFGVLAQTQLGGQLNADGTLSYRSLYQLIPSLGTGFRLFRGLLRVGYSLQWVNEAVGNVTTSSLTSLSYTNGIAQGSAISHNFGLGLTLPIKFLPTFELVVRNAGNAQYISPVIYSVAPSTSSLPANEPMTVDSSFSVQPHLGRGTLFNFVAEYRDMLNESGEDFLGRFALGGELAIRGKIFFRGGYSGGYPSAGFGVRSGKSELSLAWYTVEIGTSAAKDPDTRVMMQYQLRSF